MAGNKFKKTYKRKLLINLSLFLVILGVVAGVGLKSSYFFINNINVKNNKVISSEEIVVLSKLEGKNIFLLNKENTKKEIMDNPYIESVEITRHLPSSVTIDIKEKKIGAVIKLNEEYINIDEEGRMVQILSNFPKGKIPILQNVKISEYVPSGEIFENEDQKKALKACLSVLNIDEVKTIFSGLDVSDPFNIIFFTESGIRAYVGGSANMEYKISYVISILKRDEVKNQKGYIKVSDNGTATFKKD